MVCCDVTLGVQVPKPTTIQIVVFATLNPIMWVFGPFLYCFGAGLRFCDFKVEVPEGFGFGGLGVKGFRVQEFRVLGSRVLGVLGVLGFWGLRGSGRQH